MSLDDFQKKHRAGARTGKWVDRLPDEIKTEIMASTAGARVVTMWLQDLGYDDATENKVEQIIRDRRRRDAKSG
jgi:hypothetical protein